MMEHDLKWRWAHVDGGDWAERYVDLLNCGRPDDDPAGMPQTLAWIDAQPGERLLEVGCGNGAVACAVARQGPAIREVVAVDAGTAMIAEARRRLASRALPVRFQVADAHHLPFPDASFDRCYSMETFIILPDPRRALLELARVTRPGGHVCIRENDCDARARLGPDLELTRRLMRFVGDREYNGAVARHLIGWLKELGWEMRIVPAVVLSEECSAQHATLLGEWLADAQDAGVVTPEEAERFRADLARRQQAGLFFSYTVNFRITALKPHGPAQGP